MHIILICSPRGPCEYPINVNDIIEVPKSSLLYTEILSLLFIFILFRPSSSVGGPFYYYYYYIERTLPFFQHSERTTKHFRLFVACTKDLYNNAGHGDFSAPKIPSLYPRYGYIHPPHTHIIYIYIYGYNALRNRASKIN